MEAKTSVTTKQRMERPVRRARAREKEKALFLLGEREGIANLKRRSRPDDSLLAFSLRANSSLLKDTH